jgi:hypothetical protein
MGEHLAGKIWPFLTHTMDKHKDHEAQQARFRRSGAEFILADLELAFTFLDIASTSGVADTVCRNQENARAAYDSVLRFLPRSIAALTAAERQNVQDKLEELKSRLGQLGE